MDVNYGGSTGYRRPYRERLYGRWGIVDVVDCINAARCLVEQGKADPERLVVTGGSAGGYTTLCALTFHDAFACGTSCFGVADLEPFATSTHKFELKYTDVLVGPYPKRPRSAAALSVRHADRLSRPVLLLQGLEDEVVPPSQAEIMVEALEAGRIAYAYVAFEGEQHGFRKAESIVRALEAELTFYGRILGFEPAGDPPPLQIPPPGLTGSLRTAQPKGPTAFPTDPRHRRCRRSGASSARAEDGTMAEGTATKRARQVAREEAERSAERRAERSRVLVSIGGVALIAAVVLAVVLLMGGDRGPGGQAATTGDVTVQGLPGAPRSCPASGSPRSRRPG